MTYKQRSHLIIRGQEEVFSAEDENAGTFKARTPDSGMSREFWLSLCNFYFLVEAGFTGATGFTGFAGLVGATGLVNSAGFTGFTGAVPIAATPAL